MTHFTNVGAGGCRGAATCAGFTLKKDCKAYTSNCRWISKKDRCSRKSSAAEPDALQEFASYKIIRSNSINLTACEAQCEQDEQCTGIELVSVEDGEDRCQLQDFEILGSAENGENVVCNSITRVTTAPSTTTAPVTTAPITTTTIAATTTTIIATTTTATTTEPTIVKFSNVGTGGCRGADGLEHASFKFGNNVGLAACEALCEQEDTCTGFEYVTVENRCQLQDFEIAASSNDNDNVACYSISRDSAAITPTDAPAKETVTCGDFGTKKQCINQGACKWNNTKQLCKPL